MTLSADMREVWKRLGNRPWTRINFPPIEYTRLPDWWSGDTNTVGLLPLMPYIPEPSAMQGCKL